MALGDGDLRVRKSSVTARPFCDLLLAGRVSGAEVRDRRGTADALNPDVLDPGDVGCDVVGGDDHLRGEGLVDTVTGAVEIGEEHDRVLVGGRGLQRLGR